MAYKTYHELGYYIVDFDKQIPTKSRDLFIHYAYQLDGRTVGRKYYFGSENSRSNFLTLIVLKFHEILEQR